MYIKSHLSFVESLEAIVYSKHFVAFGDSHSDSRTNSSIHTCCWSTDVHYCHVKGALWVIHSTSHTHVTLSTNLTVGEAEPHCTVICCSTLKLFQILNHIHTLGPSPILGERTQNISMSSFYRQCSHAINSMAWGKLDKNWTNGSVWMSWSHNHCFICHQERLCLTQQQAVIAFHAWATCC